MTTPFLPTSIADMVDRDQLLSMSGLAFMEGVRDGTLASAPIAQTMNAFTETVEPGRVTFRQAAAVCVGDQAVMQIGRASCRERVCLYV